MLIHTGLVADSVTQNKAGRAQGRSVGWQAVACRTKYAQHGTLFGTDRPELEQRSTHRMTSLGRGLIGNRIAFAATSRCYHRGQCLRERSCGRNGRRRVLQWSGLVSC